MQKVKNQHYVPRRSLSRFADQDGKVWVFNKSTGKKFKTEVENVACEKYLYDVLPIMQDPDQPDKFQIVERTLTLYERIGQQAIETVLDATKH